MYRAEWQNSGITVASLRGTARPLETKIGKRTKERKKRKRRKEKEGKKKGDKKEEKKKEERRR